MIFLIVSLIGIYVVNDDIDDDDDDDANNSQSEDIVRFMDYYRLQLNLGAKIYGNIEIE